MTSLAPCPEASAQRNRSLRLAVITSLVCKVGTVALRLISIPIAIHLLGMELFGVYAAITMAVSMIDMGHIGLGPALIKQIAAAVAKGDREREISVFATSILISLSLTLLAGVVALILLLVVPIPTLFGAHFADVAGPMKQAAILGLFIILLEMLCMPFEMGRDGYQETRITNSWGAAGNVFAAILLVSGIWFFPTIEFLLIAINGSIALAKLGNTIHLLRQRPYLFPRFSKFTRALVKPLLGDGWRFTVTYIFAAAVEYNALAILIGRHLGPASVGVYNVMVTVHMSLTGLVFMFSKPYWPAIMDAHVRRDHDWIQKSSLRLRLLGMGFAFASGLGLVIVGPWLLPLWAGEDFYTAVQPEFAMTRWALAGFAFYTAAHLWRHINQVLALGIGLVNPVVAVVLAEGIFLLTAATGILLYDGHISHLYAVMAVSILLFSGWMLPRLFRKQSFPEPRTVSALPETSEGLHPGLL